MDDNNPVQRYRRLSRDCRRIMDEHPDDYHELPKWRNTFMRMCETERELRARGIDPDEVIHGE